MNKIINLKQKLIPVILTLVVILLDQISKALVVKYIPLIYSPEEGVKIIEIFGKYLRFIHVRNPAIAFSMGHNLPDIWRSVLFGVVPLIVVIVIFVIYFRQNDFTQLNRWLICGILGGGIGNLIDRFFRPAGVVDFIDCYFFGIFGMERWPTFNIADSAVVICGAIFVVSFIVSLVKDLKKSKAKKEDTNE